MIITILLALIGCNNESTVSAPVNAQITDSVTVSSQELSGFSALPPNYFKDGVAPNPQLIFLGEKLFNDIATSCNVVH